MVCMGGVGCNLISQIAISNLEITNCDFKIVTSFFIVRRVTHNETLLSFLGS